MTDWRPYAVRLANRLQASGDLRTPAWHTAIAETPRHILVPTFYAPQPSSHGSIANTRLNTAEHLELVYSTSTLVTAVVPNNYGSLVPVSSSTKPDLMVSMLETLEVRDDQRILEIGTGTGYNAALLAHRLGDENVFSLDIDPDFVNTARRRLARIGRHPHLAARDGADGWPRHGPYHRIICTCAVRRIPAAWYDQLTPGGQLLVDFKPQGGNLVLLEKKAGRLEGRFTARYAAFMIMRHHDSLDDKPIPSWRPELPLDRERATSAPAEPSGVVRFLRSITSTIQIRHGYTFDERTRQPTAVKLSSADGSWCEVELAPAGDGTRTVREGGPTRIWADIERAYQQWSDWGEPSWDRVGITVGPQAWTAWLDEPRNFICRVPPVDEQAESGRP